MKRRSSPIRIKPIEKMIPEKVKSRGETLWVGSFLPKSLDASAKVDTGLRSSPLWVLAGSMAVFFLLLFFQLFQLQVVEGERMRGIADGNRVRESVDFAPRGRILDRNGVVLAENTASFQLSVTPYLLPESVDERSDIYLEISRVLSSLDRADIASDAEKAGLDHPQPILIEENIDRELALQLEYILPQLQGFTLDAVPMREYVSDAALSHILGYVGRVDESELANDSSLYPLDFIGKTGIEAQYDEILRGVNGVKETEVDSLGRPLRTLREVPTGIGGDVHLTIDYELQKTLAKSIAEKIEEAEVEKGAGVIMDPNSGEVLASVSLPAYDNNIFARGISSVEYTRLLSDAKQPMHNRAVEGGYPTGSIIKPFNLYGALASGVVNEHTTIFDSGSITLSDGSTFSSWNRSGLGSMNAQSALAMSSNIYFFTVAGGYRNFSGMGIDTLNTYYRMFGMGEKTGIDLPNETDGRIPDPQWKRDVIGEDWYIGDTYLQAIGQGNLLASPLQMARAYAAIANGGGMVTPHLKKDSTLPDQDRLNVPTDDHRIVREGLRDVISFRGTMPPSVFENVGVDVAGKSGTAETDPGKRDPHAWFAAYAPRQNPQLVSVVLVEDAVSNPLYSAPPIAEAFEWYFNNRN